MSVDLVEVAQAFAEDCIGTNSIAFNWGIFREYELMEDGRWPFQDHLIPVEFDDLPDEAINAYHEIVDECTVCGWWVDAWDGEHSDKTGGLVCHDCYDEDEHGE